VLDRAREHADAFDAAEVFAKRQGLGKACEGLAATGGR
jgi:hypothetical protein